jgi:hypothetical protein
MVNEPDAQEADEANDRVFQPDIQPLLTDQEVKDFFPWHKPRKHYIRINQWCAETRALIRRNGYQEGDAGPTHLKVLKL